MIICLKESQTNLSKPVEVYLQRFLCALVGLLAFILPYRVKFSFLLCSAVQIHIYVELLIRCSVHF